MIGFGLNIGNRVMVGGFDADYQAVLNYSATQGYTLPSSGQQVKQNKLMLDLKAGGVWSKLDSFAVFATDGSANFALIDWKRLSQYTAVNSPAFTTNQGFKGNGASSYVNTNYNPFTNGVNFSLNNASMGIYRRTVEAQISGGSCELGAAQTTLQTLMCVSRGFNLSRFNDAGPGGVPSTDITSTGLISMNRVNSNTYNFYNNGVLHQQVTQTTMGLPNLNIYALGINDNGSFTQPNQSQFSMVYMGADLTNEQVNFTNIFNTYINSL
jgi:hypothetical protein